MGLYGLVGPGRSEIVRSIFVVEKNEDGKIYMEGQEIKVKSPIDAIDIGIGLITENLREEGLMIRQSVCFNLLAANLKKYSKKFLGFMDKKAEIEVCEANVKELSIKTSSLKKKAQFSHEEFSKESLLETSMGGMDKRFMGV